MCTAITFGRFFGRNLDLDREFDEQVVIMPRKYPLIFRHSGTISSHHALIGMAVVDRDYPLYFDAMNERGLCMAGLDFPDHAYYGQIIEGKCNIAPFELITWILCQCDRVEAARKLLRKTNIADIAYSTVFPQTPLHWIISDKEKSTVLETTRDGMQIYDNPVGVLCNNPPLPYHLHYLAGFQHLSAHQQIHSFADLSLKAYSGGMGAIGLPGDFSSPSRFVKAAFVKQHAVCDEMDNGHITQFFHLLDAVAVPRGSVQTESNRNTITQYSSCCDMDAGIYYYTTCNNRRIQAVDLKRGNINGNQTEIFAMLNREDILYKN